MSASTAVATTHEERAGSERALEFHDLDRLVSVARSLEREAATPAEVETRLGPEPAGRR